MHGCAHAVVKGETVEGIMTDSARRGEGGSRSKAWMGVANAFSQAKLGKHQLQKAVRELQLLVQLEQRGVDIDDDRWGVHHMVIIPRSTKEGKGEKPLLLPLRSSSQALKPYIGASSGPWQCCGVTLVEF